MKIELKLDNDMLLHSNEILKHMYQLSSVQSQNKMLQSIGYDLADKFDNKCKDILKKATLLTNNKKHKVTLKFHEAWALETILHYLFDVLQTSYAKMKVEQVIAQINQKMV